MMIVKKVYETLETERVNARDMEYSALLAFIDSMNLVAESIHYQKTTSVS